MPVPLSVAAAMMPAIAVPWPFGSLVASAPATKLVPPTSWPARSGCPASTPVSRTATTAEPEDRRCRRHRPSRCAGATTGGGSAGSSGRASVARTRSSSTRPTAGSARSAPTTDAVVGDADDGHPQGGDRVDDLGAGVGEDAGPARSRRCRARRSRRSRRCRPRSRARGSADGSSLGSAVAAGVSLGSAVGAAVAGASVAGAAVGSGVESGVGSGVGSGSGVASGVGSTVGSADGCSGTSVAGGVVGSVVGSAASPGIGAISEETISASWPSTRNRERVGREPPVDVKVVSFLPSPTLGQARGARRRRRSLGEPYGVVRGTRDAPSAPPGGYPMVLVGHQGHTALRSATASATRQCGVIWRPWSEGLQGLGVRRARYRSGCAP